MKKEEKKTKTENAENFRKPAKILAGVAKFRNPLRNFIEPCFQS